MLPDILMSLGIILTAKAVVDAAKWAARIVYDSVCAISDQVVVAFEVMALIRINPYATTTTSCHTSINTYTCMSRFRKSVIKKKFNGHKVSKAG